MYTNQPAHELLELIELRRGMLNFEETQYAQLFKKLLIDFSPNDASPHCNPEDPAVLMFHRIAHLLPTYYGASAFNTFLAQAIHYCRETQKLPSDLSPPILEALITSILDNYNNRIPQLRRDDLPLIGYGSRVQVRSLNQERAVRIPFSDDRDPDENRDFTKVKRYFPEFLPDPKIETIILDGIERDLVTVAHIHHCYSLQLPLTYLEKHLSFCKSESEEPIGTLFEKECLRFIEAAKACYNETFSLPDLAGRMNVVCTSDGRIYLLDINNSFVTDIYALIHSPREHQRLAHITQQVMLFSPDSKERVVYDHSTPPEELEGKIIIPIDDKEWPAFDASLKFLFDLELFLGCWDGDAHSLDKSQLEQTKTELLSDDFYAPLRSTRRSQHVDAIMKKFIEKLRRG